MPLNTSVLADYAYSEILKMILSGEIEPGSRIREDFLAEQLEKIKQNGGVIDNPKSIWLLDFWGRKNILGLINMPITRHQIVHLNDCFKIKQRYNGRVC